MKNTGYYWAGLILVVMLGVLFFIRDTGVDDVDIAVENTQETKAATTEATDSPTRQIPRDAASTPVATAQTPSPAAPAPENQAAEQNPQLAERLETMQQRRPRSHFDPDEVAAAVQRDTAWAQTDETPRHLPLEPDEFTDGRQFIAFDSLKIETLVPGDEVKVSIDETGQEYTVIVDTVEQHDYNSISWHGHIDGEDGQKYSVSFTRGEHLTVGGMDTPEGHYVLQAHGDDGWLASSSLLFKFDPDFDDVVYPDDVAIPGGMDHDHPHNHDHSH